MKQFFLFFICVFIFSQSILAQKIVNDPENNIIKIAIKGIKKEIQKMEKEGVKTGEKTLETVTKVLNETNKYMTMLESVSESVRNVSNFKKILDEQSNILTNYDKGLKVIVRSRYLNDSQRKAYYAMYQVYFKECKDVLLDSRALLKSKQLKMLDGDRITLLNKNFQKIIKISSAATYTNEVFIARINQNAKDFETLKKIENWENTYYGKSNTVENW